MNGAPTPVLTARSFIAGFILSLVLCGVNSYLTLSFGVIEEGPTIAALFFFAFFFLSSTKIQTSEMAIVATMGSAGGSLGFITNFFDVPTDILFDIISASNFLDAPDVLDAACSAAANLLRDKNPEEIRTILNIENKFTPEEEAEIIKENSWAFQPKITFQHNNYN